MSVLQNVIAKFRERNRRVGDIEDEFQAQRLATRKMLSADERELEGYMDEEHKRHVKKQLDYYRKKRFSESQQDIILNQKNIFNNHKSLFKNERSIFLNDN